jgi:hypothetical protein
MTEHDTRPAVDTGACQRQGCGHVQHQHGLSGRCGLCLCPAWQSTLSRSLVDTAGAAVFEEAKKWPLPARSWEPAPSPWLGATQQDVGRVAAVAALEALATRISSSVVAGVPQHSSTEAALSRARVDEWLLRLIAEIRGTI